MKTGPVFLIPCNRAQDLADQIDALMTPDLELINLAHHLHTFHKGFAKICVAEDDFILWPGGPDIRDFQFGGRDSETILIQADEVYSNRSEDLPSRQGATK